MEMVEKLCKFMKQLEKDIGGARQIFGFKETSL